MKKLFSISIALLMLLSGMQLTISKHYCGGELAQSKVSVLGQIASCGMESGTDDCIQPGNHIESSCCNNQVSVYAVDHNFNPSITEFKVFPNIVLQIFDIPVSIAVNSLTALNQSNINHSPPENILVNAVSLPKICVFRI
jgi:hypothetical protein